MLCDNKYLPTHSTTDLFEPFGAYDTLFQNKNQRPSDIKVD
jgi:hypothetical protein